MNSETEMTNPRPEGDGAGAASIPALAEPAWVEEHLGDRTAKPCTLWVKVTGSFKKTAKQGANSLRFSGRVNSRVNGRALAPGSHRLTAIARDSAGNLAKPVRATFTIRR